MFSLDHVRDVSRAYMQGIEQWLGRSGADPRPVKSVASLFLSRVDTLVDKRLEALGGDALALRGRAGVALAKLAYEEYKHVFGGPLFAPLAAKGARRQYLLWASTGTKNPAYSDVHVRRAADRTRDDQHAAGCDARRVSRSRPRQRPRSSNDLDQRADVFADLARLGILMGEVGDELQTEGVKLFQQSFDQLLALLA